MNSKETIKDDQWLRLKHFSEDERWGDPRKMVYSFLQELDRLRDFIGCPIRVHRGYSAKNTKSRHFYGDASDLHAEGISLFDFYLAASRFNFTGIGVYPHWNNPGLHLDQRPTQQRSLWGRIGESQYVALDSGFFKEYII